MKYKTYQTSNSDCGFVCLKILLANINKDHNYLKLCDKTHKRYNFLQLKDIATNYNMTLSGFKIDDLSLLKSFDNPLIIQFKLNQFTSHFVLLYKIKKDRYYIFDPSIGEYILTETEFKELFTGNVLAIDDYILTKCNEVLEEDNMLIKISLILNLLCSLSFFFSLFFITNYIVFIMMSLLGALFLFLQKKIGEKFIFACNDKYSLTYKNAQIISDYQAFVIKKITTIPSKVVLFLALLLIVYNAYDLGLLSVFIILFIIVVGCIIRKDHILEINKISLFESMKKDIDKMVRKSMKVSNKIMLFYVIIVIFLLVYSLIISYIMNNIGIDFLLFNVSICFATFVCSKDLLFIEDTIQNSWFLRLKIVQFCEK